MDSPLLGGGDWWKRRYFFRCFELKFHILLILVLFHNITTCQGLVAFPMKWLGRYAQHFANFHNEDWYLKNVDVELAWEENHICIPGASKELGTVAGFRVLNFLALA